VSGVLGDLSKLQNSESKKMFKIGKAAALAQVAIDTPKAAMSAYSSLAGIPIVGPALGAVAAAAAIAAGVSNAQRISSQSFGGGGSGGGSVPSTSGIQAGAQQVDPSTQVDITLQGDSFGAEGVRGLIAGINGALDDGVVLRTVSA